MNRLNHPPLYYELAGGIALLWDNPLVVRMLNVFITGLSMLVTYRAAINVGLKTIPAGFALAVLASFPMFMLTGGAISNDPLSFLSVALFAWGVLRWHLDLSHAIHLMALGGSIAALTKATAAAQVIFLSISYLLVNWRTSYARFRTVTGWEWLVTGLALALVIAWFGYAYFWLGGFYPRSGPGPESGYANAHPDAVRWSVSEHLEKFWNSNRVTTERLYGHGKFFNDRARVQNFQALVGICAALIVASTIWPKNRKQWAFVVPQVLAFLAFLVLFFTQIREMHLVYGYPGAMQARYWFGFVPVLAVIAAMGLQRLPIALQLCALALAVVAGVQLSIAAYTVI
ncbi:hypothetical protein GA830_15425 [Mesorhizobium sp. NBSH29]|nr:hypothetical protein GA830_15425 [Mesorhizobium sp. NBSH29]